MSSKNGEAVQVGALGVPEKRSNRSAYLKLANQEKDSCDWHVNCKFEFELRSILKMSNENGFQLIDDALSLAVSHLVDKGLPKDEAHIALLLRLKYLVPDEIQQVADLLSEDDELNARINPDQASDRQLSAGL